MLPLKRQVSNYNLSIELQNAGVKFPASFYWTPDKNLITHGQVGYLSSSLQIYAAYTATELGNILPYTLPDEQHVFRIEKTKNGWLTYYHSPKTDSRLYHGTSDILADALTKSLLELVKENHKTVAWRAA